MRPAVPHVPQGSRQKARNFRTWQNARSSSVSAESPKSVEKFNPLEKLIAHYMEKVFSAESEPTSDEVAK